MCDRCVSIPQEFPRPHFPHQCRLANALYCTNCASYGHILSTCPAKPSRLVTTPQYVEQLVPSSLIKSFNITTKTPLSISPLITEEPELRIVQIINTDEYIRTWLKNRGIICKSKTDMRDKLQEWAKDNNSRILFIAAK